MSRPIVLVFSTALMLGLLAWFPLARLHASEDAKTSLLPSKESGFVKVRLEPIEGEPTEGVLLQQGVEIVTDVGRCTFNLHAVRRITFQLNSEPNSSADSIELMSRSIVRGKLSELEFKVVTPDGEKTFSRTRIREIRVLREEPFSLSAILVGLITLALMEIVLGVDNVIFLTIMAGKLPENRQRSARRIGLAAALGTRLLLLFTLSFFLGLTAPLFTLPSLPLLHELEAREISWRDLILLVGGLFLIGKSVLEIHEKLDHASESSNSVKKSSSRPVSFARTIFLIALIDIVFSLDSVITAVGMVESIGVMVVAMILAMLVMLAFSNIIARIVDHHPSIKILALAFLILIGVMLVAESLGQHVDKGYIYFAMAFAVVIEGINIRVRRKAK